MNRRVFLKRIPVVIYALTKSWPAVQRVFITPEQARILTASSVSLFNPSKDIAAQYRRGSIDTQIDWFVR